MDRSTDMRKIAPFWNEYQWWRNDGVAGADCRVSYILQRSFVLHSNVLGLTPGRPLPILDIGAIDK